VATAASTNGRGGQAQTDQPVRVIFGALLLVMLLASLDQTIVSTALSSICRGSSPLICSPPPS